MTSSSEAGNNDPPQLRFTSPSFGPKATPDASQAQRRRKWRSGSHGQKDKHASLDTPDAGLRSGASSIYMGSYSHSSRRSKSHGNSAPGTPRPANSPGVNHDHLQNLLQDLNVGLESYGVEELRDGFFDAMFFKPVKIDHEGLLKDAEDTLPAAFRKTNPLSLRNFLPNQWHEIQSVLRAVGTTRSGIKLAKSFSAFFVAYILCLVPAIRDWLGRYSYIMVVSTIINHPGRTVCYQSPYERQEV